MGYIRVNIVFNQSPVARECHNDTVGRLLPGNPTVRGPTDGKCRLADLVLKESLYMHRLGLRLTASGHCPSHGDEGDQGLGQSEEA